MAVMNSVTSICAPSLEISPHACTTKIPPDPDQPQVIAPAGAPAILAISGGNYGVRDAAAGIFAIIGAIAILPVKGVR